MSTGATLEARRHAYNEYCESTVYPMLRLRDDERDRLSFEDIARRIGDPTVLRRYGELAIELLDANIAHHCQDATRIETPKLRATWVVASTLAAAGVAHHFHGAPAALGVAAIWFWVADETACRRSRDLIERARAHNEMVAEWADTLAGWEESRTALRPLLADR